MGCTNSKPDNGGSATATKPSSNGAASKVTAGADKAVEVRHLVEKIQDQNIVT